jgi:3-oxoacyl-[acyl-carrier-protein] synthase-3
LWSNDALIEAKGLESSDTWIRERTGITQRYICENGESTFTLARDAAQQAMERAGIAPADVAVLVVGTCTPDKTLPSTAALVHGALGLGWNCPAMDVNAVCSGFMYALQTAHALLKAGTGRYAVVVGADALSSLLDWNDRTTCVLFGDGAGAVVLEKREGAQADGILAVATGLDGAYAAALESTGGVATTQTAGHITMQGKEVYKHAVRYMGSAPKVLAEAGYEVADVNLWVPHQANARILTAAAASLGVPLEKVVMTVDRHANTSAASIPLALNVAVTEGRLKPGMLVVLQAFGAGLSWGEAAIRW